MYKTKDMKVTMLGVIPVLRDETGYLKPQDIVSLAALLTFKGKTVKDLYKEALEKGQDIEKKVKTIIRKSSLRGHASIATTPAISFTYEASKFLDSMMTGMIFSSSLMASGRRTDTTYDDIVLPFSIERNEKAKKLYIDESRKNIDALNYYLKEGTDKDDASKILQYGIYGTGIIAYPIESLISFKKELEAEKEWMPEEAQMVIKEIEKNLEDMGIDLVYASRDLAPRDTYPVPNIFKNPKISNMTREIVEEKSLSEDLTEIVDFHILKTPGLEEEAERISKENGGFSKDLKKIREGWRDLLDARRHLVRDYNQSISVKVLSSVSWRVWGDKKRHRTVPQTPDSLYYSIERSAPIFEKYQEKIEKKSLNEEELGEIDRFFGIPGSFWGNEKYLYKYLSRAANSVFTYFKLINDYNVEPRDAIFVIPRGVRIDVLQEYNLYNLVSGYYPLRTCSTVESQLRPLALKEMGMIRKKLEESGLPSVAKLIVPKCHISHFCLEEKYCPVIKSLVSSYTEEYHEEVKSQLDEEFEERLKRLKKEN